MRVMNLLRLNVRAVFVIQSWGSYQDMRCQEQANTMLPAADTP